ncbi:hypothetical protein GCM10010412_100250 [Nonomuraea recticatena]|uniref:Uncharacterized protein n=1 Tax=Nonomuraea recticatena TaxID=46178 RepID=A0ABN3TGI5_9ACTN
MLNLPTASAFYEQARAAGLASAAKEGVLVATRVQGKGPAPRTRWAIRGQVVHPSLPAVSLGSSPPRAEISGALPRGGHVSPARYGHRETRTTGADLDSAPRACTRPDLTARLTFTTPAAEGDDRNREPCELVHYAFYLGVHGEGVGDDEDADAPAEGDLRVAAIV